MTTELQSMDIVGCMSQKTLQLHKIRRGVIRSQQGVSWNPRVVGKLLSLSLSRPLSSSSTQLSHAPLCLTAGFLSLITVYVLSQNSDLHVLWLSLCQVANFISSLYDLSAHILTTE